MINPNIVKYREFGESKVLVWDTKRTLHSNKPPTFLLLYAITNETTVKFMQLDRLLSASKTSPAETRSNNSGRYTQGIYDNRYTYQSCWNVFLRENIGVLAT